MQHDFIFETISIILGGTVLGVGGFSLKLMWDFRRDWILDQEWREIAQKTLLTHTDDLKNITLKIHGLDTRITNIEHPVYQVQPRHRNGIADE